MRESVRKRDRLRQSLPCKAEGSDGQETLYYKPDGVAICVADPSLAPEVPLKSHPRPLLHGGKGLQTKIFSYNFSLGQTHFLKKLNIGDPMVNLISDCKEKLRKRIT